MQDSPWIRPVYTRRVLINVYRTAARVKVERAHRRGGLLLGIRLRFHNHTPQQLATFLALRQQAADELGCNLLGGASKEGLGEGWEGLGGYGTTKTRPHKVAQWYKF